MALFLRLSEDSLKIISILRRLMQTEVLLKPERKVILDDRYMVLSYQQRALSDRRRIF